MWVFINIIKLKYLYQYFSKDVIIKLKQDINH